MVRDCLLDLHPSVYTPITLLQVICSLLLLGFCGFFPLGGQLTLEMIPMSSTQCGVQSSGITFGIDIGRRPELSQLVLNQQGVFKILSQS